jgi:phage shock protein PspC (stress-responsive transcriptional regulator)
MHIYFQAQELGEQTMTAETICQDIKQALSGRPGQAIVLGVCQALATRYNKEAWCVRLAAIILGMCWTLPVLAAYVLLGLLLPETEKRTRGFFTGLGILARETAQKARAALGRVFGSEAGPDLRRRGY